MYCTVATWLAEYLLATVNYSSILKVAKIPDQPSRKNLMKET